MRRASSGGPTQAALVLDALRAARGEAVDASRLLDAMYPGGGWAGIASAPASLNRVVQRLRVEGHDIRGFGGTGLRLVEGGPRVAARKPRRCLGGCGKTFDSEGPGNRICPRCSASRPRDFVEHGLAAR